MASDDQDPVFREPETLDDRSIPSKDGRRTKSRINLNSTPDKKSTLAPPTFGILPDPDLSTISSGKKTTNRKSRNQTLSTENKEEHEENVEVKKPEDHPPLNDSNELKNSSPQQNSAASTRMLSSKPTRFVKTAPKTVRETIIGSEQKFSDFKNDVLFKELNFGMDPLQACVLLTKVSHSYTRSYSTVIQLTFKLCYSCIISFN